jgi:hypothetical protein
MRSMGYRDEQESLHLMKSQAGIQTNYCNEKDV